MTILLLMLLILAILIIVGRWAKGAFGCCCHNCGNRMHPFQRLSGEEKEDILVYFRSFEDREPDTDGIFVCENCHLVYDDFSGERKSMEGDEKSICKVCNTLGVWYMGPLVNSGEVSKFREKNRAFVERVECLQCQRNPSGFWDCVNCDTKLKVMGCRNCQTLYAWMSIYGSQFKFLVPLSDRKVLKKSIDSNWGHFEV